MGEYLKARKELVWIVAALLILIPVLVMAYVLIIPSPQQPRAKRTQQTTLPPNQTAVSTLPPPGKVMQITIANDSTASATLEIPSILLLHAYPPKITTSGTYTLRILDSNGKSLQDLPITPPEQAQKGTTPATASGKKYLVIVHEYEPAMQKLVITDPQGKTIATKDLSEAKIIPAE